MVKGDRGNHWVLKGGDAQQAGRGLRVLYDVPRPTEAYHPMRKQGCVRPPSKLCFGSQSLSQRPTVGLSEF